MRLRDRAAGVWLLAVLGMIVLVQSVPKIARFKERKGFAVHALLDKTESRSPALVQDVAILDGSIDVHPLLTLQHALDFVPTYAVPLRRSRAVIADSFFGLFLPVVRLDAHYLPSAPYFYPRWLPMGNLVLDLREGTSSWDWGDVDNSADIGIRSFTGIAIKETQQQMVILEGFVENPFNKLRTWAAPVWIRHSLYVNHYDVCARLRLECLGRQFYSGFVRAENKKSEKSVDSRRQECEECNAVSKPLIKFQSFEVLLEGAVFSGNERPNQSNPFYKFIVTVFGILLFTVGSYGIFVKVVHNILTRTRIIAFCVITTAGIYLPNWSLEAYSLPI